MATYSFLDVNASLTGPGGSFSLSAGSGNADEGITIAMIEDKNTLVIGADGTPMHSLHAGNGGTITLRYLKTSPVNNQLSQLYSVQQLSSAAWGLNVINLDNPVTGDSVIMTFVAFKKLPNVTYAKDGGMNEWVFDCGQVNTLLGGGNVTNTGFVIANVV